MSIVAASVAKAGKRPLRSLTAHEKLEAIRRVHDGESKASVARDIGVPESTLRGWCKNEDKISYLSRQSTPETDDSAAAPEPKEKRSRLVVEESSPQQPFNLSVKSNGTPVYSPHSAEMPKPENLEKKSATASAVIENGFGKMEHHHHQHHTLHATPKSSQSAAMSERERNRAELARLSIELGLNRPEMFAPAINSTLGNLAPSLPANLNLMNQWSNSVLAAAGNANKKAAAPQAPLPGVEPGTTSSKTDKEQKTETNQPVDDSVWYWLQTQQAMLGLVQNTTGSAESNCSWFWKWYKQFAYAQQQQLPDSKPILYQQLTKEKDNTENQKADEKPIKNNTKARAVLDNLMFNNNNNVAVNKKDAKSDGGSLSQTEALEHGEKFLKWLEHCSEPSVTAMQILQFRYLLSNIKNGADRRNGEQKTKVKRK